MDNTIAARVPLARATTSLALLPRGSNTTDFMTLQDCRTVDDFFDKMHGVLAYLLGGEEIIQITITFDRQVYGRSIRIPLHSDVAFEAFINLIDAQPADTPVRMEGEVQSEYPRNTTCRTYRRGPRALTRRAPANQGECALPLALSRGFELVLTYSTGTRALKGLNTRRLSEARLVIRVKDVHVEEPSIKLEQKCEEETLVKQEQETEQSPLTKQEPQLEDDYVYCEVTSDAEF